MNEIQIANVALLRLGQGKVLTSGDGTLADNTDTSAAAQYSRTLYPVARDFVIRAFPWPRLKRLVDLTPLFVPGDDTHWGAQWGYAYPFPESCAFFRGMWTALGERETAPPPHELYDYEGDGASIDPQTLVLTNVPPDSVTGTALAAMTAQIDDAERFDTLLASLISWRLSLEQALAVAKGANDPVVVRLTTFYTVEMGTAKATALAEIRRGPQPDGSFLRARGGSQALRNPR